MSVQFDEASALHHRIRAVDVHVHPALKTFLFDKRMDKRYWTGGAWNPFAMRVDLPKSLEGGINAFFSSVYLPEKKMINDCWFLKAATLFLNKRVRSIVKDDPFDVTIKMIERFEKGVEEARINGKKVAEVAKSVSDFHRIVEENKIAVIHSIEGAHSLSGKLDHIQTLFDRGVALITITHFYENELGPTVGGIPKNKKFLCCFKNEKEQTGELTSFGKEAVQMMFDLGIIVDITHSPPETRRQVIEMSRNRRPVICTHVGIHKLNPVGYNISDEEIRMIADTGGGVGNIMMNYWLVGREEKNGIHYLVDTIRHIKNVGGIDSVVIGSDLDGLTDPPDDLKDISEMPKLTHALMKAGFKEPELEKILGLNAIRILEDGWGKK